MLLTHYNLFVSSTFIDMDVERDIIKFEVIPALNQMFNKRGVDIQAIDLRYGVNTSGLSEEEASDKVLNMCVQSIDRARPFFVGFVGNRYGSIPKPERWKDFYNQLDKEQKKRLQGSTGMSITEMEILYSGLFSDDSTAYRFLFFIRDDINEKDIPEKYRSNFGNEDDDEIQLKRKKKKIENLREKIKKRCDTFGNSRCFPYKIEADKDNILVAPGLAQKLIGEISNMINAELEENISLPEKQPNWLAEGNEVRKRMFKLAEKAKQRPDIYRAIEMMEGSCLISGRFFSGKSTVLAQLYLRYLEDDWNQNEGERKILLAAVVNHSQHSRNIHQIMGRWVVELAMLLNIPQDEQLKVALVEAAPINHAAIRDMFNNAVDIIRSAGHSIHIFLDDLDQFLLSSPGDEKLDWVDDRVTVYVTACQDAIQVSDIMRLPFGTIVISDLVEDPNRVFMNSVKDQNFCELPNSICEHFAGMKYTFLEINTLFKMVRLFNKDDFKEMRGNGNGRMEQNKVLHLFESLPSDYEELFNFFLEYYIDRVGAKDKYTKLINLLKDNPEGLRVGEIIDNMGHGISAPEIYNMLYYFNDFISIEYDTEIVRLRHHPALYRSYYKNLTIRRLEHEIMEKASLYFIADAMKGCCSLIGEAFPTDINATKELLAHYPDVFNSNNLTTFVINAYLLTMYKKEKDIRSAIHHADKAIHVAEQIGESMNVCRGHIYWDKAVMLHNADFHDEAKTAGAIALGIFEQNNVVFEDLPDLYMLVGSIWEKESAVSEAVRCYQTALELMAGTDYYDAETIKAFSNYIQQLLK